MLVAKSATAQDTDAKLRTKMIRPIDNKPATPKREISSANITAQSDNPPKTTGYFRKSSTTSTVEPTLPTTRQGNPTTKPRMQEHTMVAAEHA
ncbi:hypothetical protein F2Q69_00027970 [Brassica cretica]|uniref:Uncharacterized protein n=1 Tax=Brassica cretica TaxID=69181 RepID=A0A8S9RWI8_BRACR|nr:hypothetical protein F2Q69_00027970 [Brassica cretica]